MRLVNLILVELWRLKYAQSNPKKWELLVSGNSVVGVRNAQSQLMHTFLKFARQHSNMDNIPHNARIQLAITDLKSQNHINYTATFKKCNIDRITLTRRYRGETGIKIDAISNSRKTLIHLQEKTLIESINILRTRGMPPTS